MDMKSNERLTLKHLLINDKVDFERQIARLKLKQVTIYENKE